MTDSADPNCSAAQDLLSNWPGRMIVPAFIAAEADYLISTRLGIDAELSFLSDLADIYTVVLPDTREIRTAAKVCNQYRDLSVGLADASIVVLAKTWGTTAIATFDTRHFRTIKPLQKETAFTIYPADKTNTL